MIQIPISHGELFDKISILNIKVMKIKNPDKLILVRKELAMLVNIAAPYFTEEVLKIFRSLERTNKRLWSIEDKLRRMELKGNFDQKFINTARSVYILNDRRFFYKNKINKMFGSEIKEVKHYVKYDTGSKKE